MDAQCNKIFISAARLSYNSWWRYISTSLVPPSSRRCGLLGADFPPGTRAKALISVRSPKLIESFILASWGGSICGPSSWHALRRGYAWLKACQRRAACVVLAGTADGFDKDTAVSRAQLALDDYIKQYKAENISARSPSAPCAQPRSLIGAAG